MTTTTSSKISTASTDINASLLHHFASLSDPRIARSQLHNLLDIVVLTICAVVSGCETWDDIELFGIAKYQRFKTFLQLPNGIPSHDTFNRVFSLLQPEEFQRLFFSWTQAVQALTRHHACPLQGLTNPAVREVIAIDGKTSRHTFDQNKGQRALHLISAFASAQQLVLAQAVVDGKTNEITAIPSLLDLLDVSGCIVTIDAMGCQKAIAEQIHEHKGDYILSLKENQEKLYQATEQVFAAVDLANGAETVAHSTQVSVEKGHGRIEKRQTTVVADLTRLGELKEEWAGLRTLVRIVSERTIHGETTTATRYYISSLQEAAPTMAQAIRSHWGIENQVHWILDVVFREDMSRSRQGHSPANLAVLRHLALNILRSETATKGSLRGKQKRAGWDNDYLFDTLLAKYICF